MLGAKFLLVMLIGQVPGEQADPAALVSRLGAGQFAEREAASQDLERLGRAAMPALQAARQARDAEIRERAANILHKIEGSLLTQATRVRLDFEHAPLTDVVRSLGQQAGFKVVLSPDNFPKWRRATVTLRRAEPVPFWTAIDLLCDAAMLQRHPGATAFPGPREPTFTLTDGTSRVVTPNSDHGPFRVSLLGVHYQRDVNYAVPGVGGFAAQRLGQRPARLPNAARDRINPVTSEQFTANLSIAAEPRLCVSQNGALRMIEADDDRGNSLINDAGGPPIVHRFAGYFGATSGSVVQLQVQLRRPAMPGKTIKKFRGSIPLSISSRRPDPLIVRLDQAVGKRFANAEVEVTVHAIKSSPDTPQTFLELSIRSNERPNSAAESVDSDAFGDIYRTDTHRQQLEIYDSRDQLVPWFPSGIDSDTSRLTLTLMKMPTTGSLRELRYYNVTRASVNVPFEFADIPLP
jgi:hypothetical protein